MRALFFSRGKGRGHAVPDVAIVEELLKAQPQLDLHFVSYGTGASMIKELGYALIDLNLPEENPFIETLVRITRLINKEKPDVIVSHEEFAAMPAARSAGISAIFISDWLPSNRGIFIDCLNCADEMIFLDEPGYFDEPEALKGKISYVGPVLRSFVVIPSDKAKVRAELGLPQEAKVTLVLPGSSSISSEAKSPICDLVIGAFDLLPYRDKVLIWVVDGEDYERLSERSKVCARMIIKKPHTDIERTMIASDVAITKATRITCLELNALGVPSISISFGLNPIDDYRISRIHSNCTLRAGALTPTLLTKHLDRAIRRVDDWPVGLRDNSSASRTAVVNRLLVHIRRIESAVGSNQ